jgi:ribosomal protein S18 acetylase RimI-like enzyme
MNSRILVRVATRADVDAIKPIVDATLFPADLLDDMIAPFLDDPACRDVWLVAERDDAVLGVTFCEPERLTDGTWNMLAIAVDPERQGAGVGSAMTSDLEARLLDAGARVLIVETSGLPAYERTRAFNRRHDYVEEARIRDFYAAHEDKVVFWKKLPA